MGTMNASESLVEPPIVGNLPPNGGDMGEETVQPRSYIAVGIVSQTRRHSLIGRPGQAGTVGPTGSRLRANRGHLPPYADDNTENTGRLVGCPKGLGWHEA